MKETPGEWGRQDESAELAAERAHPTRQPMWLSLAKRTMNRLHEAPCGIELSARKASVIETERL